MFSCSCCEFPRSFEYKKSLYRHQRKTGTYVDPRAQDARERRETYAGAPKSCEACGVEFSYEDVVTGSKVKYCSRSCAATVNNIVPKRLKSQERVAKRPRIRNSVSQCTICSGQTGTHTKLYCSDDCRKTSWWKKQLSREEKWSAKTRKAFLIREHGSRCQVCGITEWNGMPVGMELDHIDGNSADNSAPNTRLICPTCHSQTPTYKNRNAGNGRHARRQRYAAGKSY